MRRFCGPVLLRVLQLFESRIADPKIPSVHRSKGDLDYLIMARVANMEEYDGLYQQLTQKVHMSDVSTSFAMESSKDTTELPVLIN
jgi:Lrp/AsnC family transcriptional regulator